METFTEQYFAKCANCEEIGVRIENRNPKNKRRFCKPELTVKTYSEETTCPDYIVKGLDGIYRREVTNKDILNFGFEIDGKVDKILEKRKTRALAITKKFKAKEEKAEIDKLREKTKKENTKIIRDIKREQDHQAVLTLCQEISKSIMTLLEMHLSKKEEHVQYNERVLREHYELVWRIVEEEIRKRVETFIESYMSDSEDELHKMLDELELKFEAEYWDLAEWAVNKAKEMEIEAKDAAKAANKQGRMDAAAEALRVAREEAESRRRLAREEALRRIGNVDSKGNLTAEDFDLENAKKILEWRKEIIDMLEHQLAIAEAERNQVEDRVKETCRSFKGFISSLESEIDDDELAEVEASGGDFRADARERGVRIPEVEGGTGFGKYGKRYGRIGPMGIPGSAGLGSVGGVGGVGGVRGNAFGGILDGNNNESGSKTKEKFASEKEKAAKRKEAVHRIFQRHLGISGPFDARLEDDEFIVDVLEKLNELDDGWNGLSAGERRNEEEEWEGDNGKNTEGDGEGGVTDGMQGGSGDLKEGDGKESEGVEFCLTVEERVEYRQDQANQRRIIAEGRRKEREEEEERKEAEERRKKAEEPTDEEIRSFEEAVALVDGIDVEGAPWVAY